LSKAKKRAPLPLSRGAPQRERGSEFTGEPAAPPLPEGQKPTKKPSGLSNLLLHLHPRVVPKEALRIERTFGLGGMAVVLFLVLIVTGALLLFSYQSASDQAYASIVMLEDDVPFGAFVRSIHHWAGNGLLVVAFLHLVRVFYTGAFLPPRRFNWGLGLALLALIMAANFTGYLLPWDQLAFWAVTIGSGMLQYVPLVGEALVRMARGGPEVGPKTLSLFFVLHIAIVPILLFLLTMFHFWLVRKAGGVMLPAAPNAEPRAMPELVPVRPNLTLREGIAALVLLAALLTISAAAGAPLGEQANAGMSPNPAKAPWYFMGLQELLVHIHPAYAVLVVPLLVGAFILGFPFLRYDEAPSGLWFHSSRGRTAALAAAGLALVVVSAAVVLDEFVLHWARILPGLPPAVSTGLIPIALWGAVVAGLLLLLRILFRMSRIETVQALFTFLVTALFVLTVVGVLFRGQSMRLVWPLGLGQ